MQPDEKREKDKAVPSPVDYGNLQDHSGAYIYRGMREGYLRTVNDIEMALGISPTTAQIRAWWRKQGKPETG